MSSPDSALAIAMVEPTGAHSGMHYYNLDLARALVAEGCRVSLHTSAMTEHADIPGLDVFLSYRGVFGDSPVLVRALRFARATVQVFVKSLRRREKICHYQVFNNLITESIVIGLAHIFRRRLVLVVHDVSNLHRPGGQARWWTARLYNSANRILAHNQTTASELIGIGIRPEKISVVPFGVYQQAPLPVDARTLARQELGISENAKVLLFFGHIKEVKGLDILLNAMPEVLKSHPETRLLIAGRPVQNNFSLYAHQMDELGISSNCEIFLGHVPDEKLEVYFAAADLVVLPYRKIYQSGVLMMAMAYNRAVVVSDLPGMMEVVTDRITGYSFATESSSELAQTLIRALSEPEERERIARSGGQHAREYHDWAATARETVTACRSLLNRP